LLFGCAWFATASSTSAMHYYSAATRIQRTRTAEKQKENMTVLPFSSDRSSLSGFAAFVRKGRKKRNQHQVIELPAYSSRPLGSLPETNLFALFVP
jgi:hypothetical protein